MQGRPLRHTETPERPDAAPSAPPASAPGRRVPLWRRIVAGTLKAVLPLAILAAAAYGAREIYLSAPTAEPRAPERVARLVEVAPVAAADAGPRLEAWGAAEPARTLNLRSEVAGRVIALNPDLTPGGIVSRGEELIRLDDRELSLALAEAEAEIRRIDAQIAIERGQGARAARDLERLSSDLTQEQRALVLREPQMAELQAQRAAALAARDAAALALSKTRIVAPFDAIVRTETVAEGTMLSAGAEAATLISADRIHVTLAVPPAALAWIDPEAGQRVRLTQPGVWPEGQWREGEVLRLKAELTEAGRMAALVVGVTDPMARKPWNAGKPQILVDSYLRAEIVGPAIPGAVALDRAWLREGDTAWVMGADDRLEIRALEVAWRTADEVLVTGGLAPGDRVVTTQIATVADGMALRTAKTGAETKPEPTGGAGGGEGEDGGGE